MKKLLLLRAALTTLAVIVPLAVNAQTTFFSDGFTNASTIDAATPAPPTTNSTSYETVTSETWSPTPSITAHDLRFGIASAAGQIAEIQALFANSPVALTQVGDYIQLTVVFTNFSGVFGGTTPIDNTMGFGLFSSGQVAPLGGGLSTEGTANVPGGVNGWEGYNVIVGPTGNGLHYEIMTRPAQTSGTGNQDLVTRGSSSKGYLGYTAVSATPDPSPAVPPTTNQCYTDVLYILLNGANSLAITNSLYLGPNASVGTLLTQIGGIATNTTYLVSGFDGLAVGFYQKTAGPTNTLDITSIQVTGQSTPVLGPPIITAQPLPVAVPSGAACDFNVAASGFGLTYQWHRNGTNLVDGGNISGSTSEMLVISPAGSPDVASGANGYWVTVSGTGGYSTNSTTNLLSLTTAKTLEWTGAQNNVWDLDTTANWQNQSHTAETFNFGDSVTFDDVGGGGFVNLTNSFLSASTVTINSQDLYTFESTTGNGSIAGPGSLWYIGSGQWTLNEANSYTGGTVISNASAHVYLENYAGLGNGPVTLALAGGEIEAVNAGSGNSGINGNIIVNDDFTILADATGSYGTVFLGDLSGVSGKTLTINAGGSAQTRVRAYGTNTVYNANLNLASSYILFAPDSSDGSQTYNGVISGSGAVMEKGTVSYFYGQNTYSGSLNIPEGSVGLGADSQGPANNVNSGPLGTGPLLLTIDSTTTTTGSGQIMAVNGSHTIGNSIEYSSGTNNLTLIVGGTNNLTFTGTLYLNGPDFITTNAITTRTLQVTNTGATILSGGIVDNSSPNYYALTKTGSGALYLDGASTYSGWTTNNSDATNTPGLLAGMGTIAGPVFVQTNSAIGGGSAAAIGTLTINNSLTLNGNGWFRLNKSLGQPNDVVSVSGSLVNVGTGTITVTNLGPTLAIGDKFTLFNKLVSGGNTLAIAGGGMNWTNRLAVDGSIQALSVASTVIVPTIPPGITNFSLAGGNVVINGTNGQAGGTYYLLMTTNLATPRSQWHTVATNILGSSNYSFVGTNAVGNSGPRFYMLSSTNSNP